jgi:flagellar hook-associated protein 2
VGIQSTGIGSNLDVNSLISKLMQVESQPLVALAKKESSYQAKLSAYGNLSSAVSAFQSSLTSLNSASAFQAVTATSGDSSIVTGSTTSLSTAGSYNVNITQLAQSQIISSAGKPDTSSAIGAGATTTVSFQFGTITGGTLVNGVYSPVASFAQDATQTGGSITIDSTNNSLQGIKDAVNKAAIGVSASIVGDGDAVNPYHLVLTSTKTGATSSLKIAVTGDAALGALLDYNPAGTQNLKQIVLGQNAQLTVNGIAISSASNQVTGAIQGSTINAVKIGTSTLNLAANTGGIQASINGFVKSYNDLQSTLTSLTSYNAATKVGGILLGDATARGVQNQIRSTLSGVVNGLGGGLTTLSSVGVRFQKDGILSVDATKLQAALTASSSEVSGVFATVGKATDSLVSYNTSTSATKQGAYTLNVTAIASKGALTGDADLNVGDLIGPAGTTTIASGTTIDVTLNGATATIPLTAGVYTASQLSALVQSSINANTSFVASGATVTASVDSLTGFLKLQSDQFGSISNVTLANGTNPGTSVARLTGTLLVGTAGADAAGTFNGVSATGLGQNLTGVAGADTEGLQVAILGGSTGSRGTVNFSRGFASQLTTLNNSFLGTSGAIAGTSDGVGVSIKAIGKQRTLLTSRLYDVEARYRAQFTALDRIISGLNNTSSFLTQQLAAINTSTK